MVEYGFSINENLLQVNMKVSRIVSQRLTYKDIHRGRGVVEVKVTPELLKCIKSSYCTYKAAHEEARKKESKTKNVKEEIGKPLSNLMVLLQRKRLCFLK